MTDVILVDEHDNEVGLLEKLAAHTHPGALHRAVSVFVFDSKGALVLQRRAPVKYHFGGRWSNTACTHPAAGESEEEAARRCLVEEMAMDVEVRALLTFRYRAEDDSAKLVEHELDHVFVGMSDEDPSPRLPQVMAWSRRDPLDVMAAVESDPSPYTPWLGIALPLALDRLGTAD